MSSQHEGVSPETFTHENMARAQLRRGAESLRTLLDPEGNRTDEHFAMDTLGGYFPLAGSARNTIRLYQPKYENLFPGSRVSMNFYLGGNPDASLAIAHEMLVVKSVAISDLNTIIKNHAYNNCDRENCEHFKQRMVYLYGAGVEDSLFMAIYFW